MSWFFFPATFLVCGAVYPFFWHLMPGRWLFVDRVRGIVLQNGHLNLPAVSITGSQWPESETLSSTSACALAAKWVRTTVQWANSQTTECHFFFPCTHSPVPFSFFLSFWITSPSTHPHSFHFQSFLSFLTFQLSRSLPSRHMAAYL